MRFRSAVARQEPRPPSLTIIRDYTPSFSPFIRNSQMSSGSDKLSAPSGFGQASLDSASLALWEPKNVFA